MTLHCPHCGGEITGLLAGTSPFPGWEDPAQFGANGRKSGAQFPAQSGPAQSKIARELESLSTEEPAGRRPYNTGYTVEFLRFWKIYPLKRNKRKAFANWRNAIRRASVDVIIAGAERYRDDPNREDGFTKYAEGWLSGDAWEDDPLPPRIDRRRERPPDPPRPMTSGEMDRAIAKALRDE